MQQAGSGAEVAVPEAICKQLGIALHSYLETYLVFPYATSNTGRGASPALVTNATGLVSLLPYIDQGPLFNKYNPNEAAGNFNPAGGYLVGGGATATGNGVLASTRIALYLCPSDDGRSFIRASMAATAASRTSRRTGPATTSASITTRPSATLRLVGAGPLDPRDVQRLVRLEPRDVPDGLSNTVAMRRRPRTSTTARLRRPRAQHVGGGISFSVNDNGPIELRYCCVCRRRRTRTSPGRSSANGDRRGAAIRN